MATTTADNDTASPAEVKANLKLLIKQREDLEQRISDASGRLHAPGQPGLKDSLIDKEGYPRSDVDIAAVRGDRHTVITLTNDHKALTRDIDLQLVRLHALARGATTPAAPAASESGTSLLGDSTARFTEPASAPNAGSSPGPSTHQKPVQPAFVCGDQDPRDGGAAPMDATTASSALPTPTSAPPSAPTQPQLQSAVSWNTAMDVESSVSDDGGASSAAAPGSSSTAGGASAGGSHPSAVTFRLLLVVDEVTEGSPACTAGLQVGDQVVQFGEASLMDAEAPAGGELQRIAAMLPAREGLPTPMLLLRQGRQMTITLTPQRWAGRGLLGCHLRPL